MAWMLFGIGLTLLIAGVTTVKILAEIVEWIDDAAAWIGSLFNIACWALIGYPGAYLVFTRVTGVGL